MSGLTTEQVAAYFEQGYLFVEGLLSDEDIDPLLREVEATIDGAARKLHAEGRLDDLYEDAPFARRLSMLTPQCPDVFRAVFSGKPRGPQLLAFLLNPKILAVM